eukprot:844620-Pleurochrysis_carterae.AAC.2
MQRDGCMTVHLDEIGLGGGALPLLLRTQLRQSQRKRLQALRNHHEESAVETAKRTRSVYACILHTRRAHKLHTRAIVYLQSDHMLLRIDSPTCLHKHNSYFWRRYRELILEESKEADSKQVHMPHGHALSDACASTTLRAIASALARASAHAHIPEHA